LRSGASGRLQKKLAPNLISVRNLDFMIKVLCLLMVVLLLACRASSFAGAHFESQPLAAGEMRPITPSTQYDTPPKLLRGYAPFYPPGYAIKRKQGDLVIEFSVGLDGKTANLRVVSSTSPAFAKQAIDAVKKWQFTPALKHGQPVVVRVQFPFKFRA
jgi:TonB family protein